MVSEIRSTYSLLTVLVSYFNQGKKEVVCEHLALINVPAVTTENILNTLINFFKEKSLPWKNLLATLMDSCNVMQGSKNGLEKQIKEKLQPNLLGIDGDSCHHIHNVAKKFMKHFDAHFELLFLNICNDFKWSEDLRELLKEIYLQVNTKYISLKLCVATRSLSDMM